MTTTPETDVFSDNAPSIVDCDVLEAAKENIQPLASGRRVTALSAILSTPHAQRESRLGAARQRLRINVEIALEDEDDDPLEAYSRLVNWTVENYPQGPSAESGLIELLEEATRVLRDDRDGRWKDDLRYLKLWMLYASYVEKPAIVYKFCLVNDIGTTHSLLYEDFALALEKAGRRTEADETYLLGIARRAAPLERLEARHREFQKRMMSPTSLPPTTSQSQPPPAPVTTKKKILGEASSSRSSSSIPSSRIPTRVTRSTSRTTASNNNNRSNSVNEDVFAAPAPARPNARMQIFVDPSGSSDQSNPSTLAPWPELGTRKSRIKENVRETSKMAGSTLKQSSRAHKASSSTSSGSGSRGTKMEIFRDPVPEEDMPPPPAPSVKKHKAGSTSKSSISVFRDEEPSAGSSKPSETPQVPSTPKFTPYRDADSGSPSSRNAVPGSVMKDKSVASSAGGVRGVQMSSEAEALRKDPLKNYGEEALVGVVDL